MAAEKPKEYRNPMLQIRISPDLEQRLNRVADMYGVTKGEIARMAIGQYVGQVTGSIDSMAERVAGQTQAVDWDKVVQTVLPKLIEMDSNRTK